MKRLTMSKKFRPISLGKFNWVSYDRYYPDHWRVHHQTLSKIFSRLHYLARHSPESVRKRHQLAYNRFVKQHFTRPMISMNYINTYSAESWM